MEKIEAIYPLSPVQQGMLFHTLYAPETGVYVEQLYCTLRGDLDVDAFERAWQRVLDRHPVLRTAFVWEDVDDPVQVVHQHVPIPVTHIDWRGLAGPEQQARLAAFRDADQRLGFNLSLAPLIRLTLFHLTDGEYEFLWSHHHILLDGWSLPLVLEEIVTCYEAFRNGREATFPRRRPYRDYIAWLKQQNLDAAETFWRDSLAGFSSKNSLDPGPPELRGVESDAGTIALDERELELSEHTTEGLQLLARRHHLTLNTVIQGAWALLLSRYSGDDDVVFGATVSGRPTELEGVDAMIGLFINTLPVRVRVAPDARLIPWLEALQAQQAEMRRFEFTPLSEIQRWSEVPKGSPLFESIVVFENYPMDESLFRQPTAFDLSTVRAVERTNYPLTVTAIPGSRLQLEIGYERGRFDAHAIDRMIAHLRALLEGMLADPGRRLSELPLLSEAERRQLLEEWSDGGPAAVGERCLHELVEAQVARTPEAVAAVFEGGRLSYVELDRRANRLARHLRGLGVGPEVRVGLCLERSIEMVVGMLGILKAGGAYVPLDPSYPRERLALMVADSEPAVVLTREGLGERFVESGARLMHVDGADGEAVWREDAEGSSSGAGPDNLAYVIYTSGSTGTPRGVGVTHRGIGNRLRWGQSAFPLDATDRVLQKTSASFDVSVWEVFAPLVAGARVVLAGRDEHLDAQRLVERLNEEAVTVVDFVPSMLRVVLDEPRLDAGRSLRRITCGGEAVPADLVERFFGKLPDVELVNFYGPTEVSIDATCGVCSRAAASRGLVPIGRPIGGVRVYVLDGGMGPVPVGVPGELYVGGVGLARGYWGRPDLTAERFVPDPFGREAGSRLYRTGDRVRYLEEGTLEFLGRADTQVKVRGYRIELGEIESVLLGHGGVREAVVVAREERVGEKRLAAYVVVREGFEVGVLREYLRGRLPEYMVPSWFVKMERLPLTPNGKVDRRALPAPERGVVEGGRYVAPRTEREGTLAGIWSEVLGVERVGVEDNFFELGGDSILSIQVVSRAGGKGIRITPRQVFEHQTIAALAGVAESSEAGVEAEQGRVAGEVPLTAIQRWFFEEAYAGRDHWNQAVLLEVGEGVDVERLGLAVRGVGEHHDALRLRYERDGEGWHQRYAEDGEGIVWDRRDLSGADEVGEAIERVASEVQRSLDLGRGPLARAVYLDLGRGRGGRLLLVIHHLVVDGVSWRIVLEDVVRGYEQLGVGSRVDLPVKTTSLKAWSERVTEYVSGGGVDGELGYWSRGGMEGLGKVPRDHAGGRNTEGLSESVTVRLGEEETRKLLQEVPAAYRTEINDVLLTGLVEGLRRWTGRRRWVVDLEGHGREEWFAGLDLSRTVGWFTTVYPVELQVGEVWSAGDALKGVKESLRGVPRRGMGYGLLRYVRGGEAGERLRGIEGAEVSFNYLGQLDRVLERGGGLRWAPEGSGATRASDALRSHVLDVNAQVVEGCLETEWTYGGELHRRETVEQVAEEVQHALGDLIAHCVAPGVGGYTPSDFPQANLNQVELDALLRDLEGSTGRN